MRKQLCFVILGAVLIELATPGAHGDVQDTNWPNWRGPNSDGVAVNGNPPVTWSETKNIKWKIKIQGEGLSTPVVWGNKMFLQTAIPTAEEPKPPQQATPRRRGPHSTPKPTAPYKFNVVCLDRHTGEVLWERTVREEIPHEGHHPSGSFASSSPVTDGEHVWASFGSRGLYCLDLDGNVKWTAELGQMRKRMTFGEGSSPALAGNAVIVVMDHEGDSKIAAYDKVSGKLLWERSRDEGTNWSTPLPVKVGDTTQIVTCATRMIRSYDLRTGDLIWQTDGLTLNAIPTPVVGFGNVYCTSGFRGYSLKAIKLGRTGDLSDSDAIAWEVGSGTPYVASPLLYDDRIYVLQRLGAVLSCYEASTGKPIFLEEKLEGLRQIYASPIGAAQRVYIADRSGTTIVIKHSDTLEVLATNRLDDGFDASPIVIGDELYLRGNDHLYCISEQ